MNERESKTTATYWAATPWRSWGVVTGSSPEEVAAKAEEHRAAEIRNLEAWIERVRKMTFTVEQDRDDE